MKTTIYSFIFLAAVAFMTSCGGDKKVASVVDSGAKEITLPLSGREYQTDKEHFRAVNYGKSPDLATAKKIALVNAKTELASNITTTIKAVTENYTNQRTVGAKQEFENKFEEMSRNVVNQKLSNIGVIGDKIFQEKDGSYTYWIAIEASKEEIINGVNSSISKDKKLQLDYDKHKYEEIFNEEMKKFEEGN